MKKLFHLLVVLFLTIQFALPVGANSSSHQQLDYLALGDSLAVGVIEDNTVGNGYADLLAAILEKENLLNSFNKGFSHSGYKTTDILEDLQEDIVKPSIPEGKTESITAAIKEAEVITISVGANDVLSHLERGENGEFIFNIEQVVSAIQEMGKNLNEVLLNIRQLNEDAQVFVMGYYNPYPTEKNYALQFNYLVSEMDKAVDKIAASHKMHFVKVSHILASDSTTYLPNPKNIHPSEEGYEAIAEEFYKKLTSVLNDPKLPDIEPQPIFVDIDKHWAKAYIKEAASNEMIKGFTDGTFRPDDKIEKVHFTSILVRSLQLEARKPVVFKDVANYNEKTRSEIAAAHEARIVRNTNNLFYPKHKVTRVEVARMLYNAYTYKIGEKYTITKMAPFKDISKYSKEDQLAMTMLYNLKIAVGYPNGTFKPDGQITRAEATKMLLQFIKTVK